MNPVRVEFQELKWYQIIRNTPKQALESSQVSENDFSEACYLSEPQGLLREQEFCDRRINLFLRKGEWIESFCHSRRAAVGFAKLAQLPYCEATTECCVACLAQRLRPKTHRM